jgi:hypothetical protein
MFLKEIFMAKSNKVVHKGYTDGGVVKTNEVIDNSTGKILKSEIKESHSEELVPDPYARIEIGHGVTLNLGDYNSARLYVSVSLPCSPDKVSLKKTVKKCQNISNLELKNMVSEYQGDPE